ncbi:MAG: hypothetical protein IT385_19320 [Deltaproteobacteria bacterium]|nr:hypothetical protein [Deltaproteobacteria bacterium]
MRLIIAIASLCLAAAACGDDDDNNQSDITTSTDATTTDSTSTDTGADTEVPLAEKIERGRYLVENVAGCPDCHTPRKQDGAFDETRKLAGIDCFVDADPTSEAAGCLSTANLTHHATGLMNRTDQQIKDMIQKGERPDGKFLNTFMPYWVFGNISASDMDAIVAYLRSTTGVDHTVSANQPPFDNVPAAAPVVDLDDIPMPRADYSDKEAAMRGRYLAANVGPCLDCHTQATAPGSPEPKVWSKAFQGAEPFPRDAFGLPPFLPEMIYSVNLTPHATGLAGWTVADVKRVLKEGISKDGKIVCPPMPAGPGGAFGGLTDADAEDIAHFIVSLEPQDNAIPNQCAIDPPR